MVCIIDFDKTFLKNDFFEEYFYSQVIHNPFGLAKLIIKEKGNWVTLKHNLLQQVEIPYTINFLINQDVSSWMEANRGRFHKMVVVSASPDFFVKKVLAPLNLFDEIHGSTSINLKGVKKLEYIHTNWGSDFAYIGDSKADIPIFKHAKEALKVTKKGLVNVGN